MPDASVRERAELQETGAELDEMGRELRVKGRAGELESCQLLRHAGEVVTKGRIIGRRVARCDGGRWILGDRGLKAAQVDGDDDHPVIVTVPRVGSCLVV